MRVVIDLSEEDLRALRAAAKADKISQAEAIRRAIRGYLAAPQAQDRDSSAFGLWAGRAEGVAYQRDLREEWSE